MSKQTFAEHAYDLCTRPGYYQATWQLIEEEQPINGVYGHFMDRSGRVIVVRLLYSEGYPDKPPLVISSPPIRSACFDNKGILHFATKNGLFVWKKYQHYSNPLVYLVDELANEYKAI